MPLKVKEFDIKAILTSKETVIDGVQVKIANAGMVLLHPFMKALFKDLGLLEGLKMIGEKSQERAACIWQYLATGSDEFQDSEMLLPKILSGFPTTKTVNPLPVSDFEQEVCGRHLNRILKYWGLARDLDELRRRFLSRNGVLEKDSDAYHLFVEQRTEDATAEGSFRSPVTVLWPWQTDSLVVHWDQ